MLQHLQLKPGTLNIKPGGKVSLNRMSDAGNVSLKILVGDVKSVILEKLPEGLAQIVFNGIVVDHPAHIHGWHIPLRREDKRVLIADGSVTKVGIENRVVKGLCYLEVGHASHQLRIQAARVRPE